MKVRNPIIGLALLLCLGMSANAATYYISSLSGNDSYSPAQAQNSATPWRSLKKLSSFWGSINPGDVIMLQRGSVFTDPLQIWKGGTAAAGITITTYGSGNAPVLSGFGALSGWSNIGGNYWAASCSNCGLAANMVTVADSAQPMGRWPNAWSNPDAGYAQIQSYNGTVSITDSHIGTSGHNWTGANIAIRKNRWVIENDTVLSQSGNTITYKSQTTFTPADKFGYFVQNSSGTLDQPGEWWYNPGSKSLEIYSTVNPSTMNVQVSRADTILYINSVQYVTINGLAFQGANYAAIALFRSNFVTIQNCSVNFSGRDAFDITSCNNLNINNVNIRNSNNNGVMAYCNSSTIQNCTVARTAAFPGMTMPANSGIGIYLNGNNNNILYNTVDTTGYTAIYFMGMSNTIA
ncbi:MAG TPA: right-handed parallel beta-helix repeat-containing protein, partial [Puia sp.]|nr:right-handed parallel beta-helix repeat-containing protein [Puia sp.]